MDVTMSTKNLLFRVEEFAKCKNTCNKYESRYDNFHCHKAEISLFLFRPSFVTFDVLFATRM